MLDISRDRVPKMETLRSLIDLWTGLKYNQLQLYTEHTFAYPQHYTVWKDASPITGSEAEEIAAYCSARGMELVPNQNSFGHMERWLAHDEYRHMGEATGPFTDPWGNRREIPTTLSPAVTSSIEFLAGLYDELLPHFSSSLINVGGDETYELGTGRSREEAERKGVGELYLDFIRQIHSLLSKRNRRIMIYADIILKHGHLVEKVPGDIILINWGYESDHPFEEECRRIAEAGLEFYVCPGTSSWNSIGGRWENARKNILAAAQAGLNYAAAGFLLADWGDNGHMQQLPVSVPAYFLGAAAAWNTDRAADFNPVTALALFFFKTENISAAEALMLMQNLYQNERALIPNASIQALLITPQLQPEAEEFLAQYRDYDFSREIEVLEMVEKLLSGSDREIDPLLKDELEFTMKLLRHACRQGRLRFAAPHLRLEEIDAQDRHELAEELDSLADEYLNLWKRRSRPGGLDRSVSRMDALKERYRS
jgi:hypothetical protein